MIAAEAAVARERNAPFSIETLEVSDPVADEVLVRIVACGLCHTDLIVRDGYREVSLPAVLGHEGAGVVEAVGPLATKVKPGDSVILSFPSCGRCVECLEGRPANCPHLDELYHRCQRDDGTSPFSKEGERISGLFAGQSSFASHTIAPERNVIPVPVETDLKIAAPLGCGVITGAGAVLNALQVPPGSTIAVFGLGAVGMSAVMAARLCGCAEIIGVDLSPARLDVALEVGATAVVNASEADPLAAIEEQASGGVDYSVEASGHPPVLLQAIHCLAGGGSCVFVGNHPEGSTIDLEIGALEFNQSVRGCVLGNCVPETFIPMLLDLQAQGHFPIERLVELYPLAELNRAVDDALAGTVIKPVIVMPK
jgi:aryl-alcohol dehydrogenase